jgi:hypothetical protein
MDIHTKEKTVGRFLKKINESGHVTQNIGKNIIATMPKKIAEYLQLPEPSNFTGHTFRRSGATFLADAGCQMMTLKRAGKQSLHSIHHDTSIGGWNSESIVQEYIDDSTVTKYTIASAIDEPVNKRMKVDEQSVSSPVKIEQHGSMTSVPSKSGNIYNFHFN